MNCRRNLVSVLPFSILRSVSQTNRSQSLRLFLDSSHLTPLFPTHTAHSPVTLILPTLTEKQGGTPHPWFNHVFHFGTLPDPPSSNEDVLPERALRAERPLPLLTAFPSFSCRALPADATTLRIHGSRVAFLLVKPLLLSYSLKECRRADQNSSFSQARWKRFQPAPQRQRPRN